MRPAGSLRMPCQFEPTQCAHVYMVFLGLCAALHWNNKLSATAVVTGIFILVRSIYENGVKTIFENTENRHCTVPPLTCLPAWQVKKTLNESCPLQYMSWHCLVQVSHI